MSNVSKRMRFEVLKRDNYSCTYCGAKAPDVVLHVDHVIPDSLGGSSDASNLTTSCSDCNLGKASTVPDGELVAAVDEKAERWRQAISVAAQEMSAKPFDREVAAVAAVFEGWCHLSPADLESIRRQFVNGLPLSAVIDAAEIARYRPYVKIEGAFSYFMGICRNKLQELHERAKVIMDEQEPSE